MIFFNRKKDFLAFIENIANELGLKRCPKCNKEDILLSLSKCTNCNSQTLEANKSLILLYSIEIIKEFTQNYDEKNPKDVINQVLTFFEQLIIKLKNNEMPTNSEMNKLQSLFTAGNLGGLKFGGFVTLKNGKPEVNVSKDLSNKENIIISLSAVALSILYINKLASQMVNNFSADSTLSGLIQSLNSSDPNHRLSVLGIIVNYMWSKNEQIQADAIKAVSKVLYSDDMEMIYKAASALNEKGSIGARYLEFAAADQRLNSSIRSIILTYSRMSAEPHLRRDLRWENLKKDSQNIIFQALNESKYHNFSSIYVGLLPEKESFILRYVFELDFSRSEGEQAVISFQYFKCEEIVADEFCLPVVSAFAKNKQYKEIFPTQSKSRYFSWNIV